MQRPQGWTAFASFFFEKDRERMGEVRLTEEWPSEELFNAQKALEDLQHHPGWAVFQELIGSKQDQIHEQVTYAGQVLEQGQYARQHGILAGLQMTRDVPRIVGYAAQEAEKLMASAEAEEA